LNSSKHTIIPAKKGHPATTNHMLRNLNRAMDQQNNLSTVVLRTVWIFQFVAALPVFLFRGGSAFFVLWGAGESMYDFVTDFVWTILSGGVLFSILHQRKLTNASWLLTLRFETARSLLASILWVWLMLDAIFLRRNSWRGPEYGFVLAAISSSLLV
jgi:hypothetical protein